MTKFDSILQKWTNFTYARFFLRVILEEKEVL